MIKKKKKIQKDGTEGWDSGDRAECRQYCWKQGKKTIEIIV